MRNPEKLFEIELVNHDKAIEIIEHRGILGLFITKSEKGDKYVAIDNGCGYCWVEEFASLYVANCWLLGTMDTDEAYKVDEAITRVAKSIKQHEWYKDYPMEKCREMAEYQILKLRDSQKRKGAK